MIPSLTTLLSTAAGKIAVGVVVATISVGAAAAAGADVPFVSTTPTEVATTVETTVDVDGSAAKPAAAGESALQALEMPAGVDVEEDVEEDTAVEGDDGERPQNHGAVVSGFVHETELEGCEKGQATAAVARGDILPGEDGTIDPAEVDAYLAESGKCLDDEVDVEEDTAVEGDDGERPENHGAVVSGFVHETELEGCEKGQATAAVARGDILPGEDGTIDPAAVDAYLAESGKCLDEDDDGAEVDDANAEETEVEQRSTGKPDQTGKPDHAEKGKPDHAGKGKPDHAGKAGKPGK